MNGRRRLGVIAALATLLASAPLTTIFETWGWFIQSVVAVGLICGAAALTRTLRFPSWVQTLGMLVALLLAVTWLFPAPHGFVLPGPAAFRHFGNLLRQVGTDTRNYAVPVPDSDSLQFLAVLGIGAVAIAVDLLTVVARKPALAGLPMLAIYSVPVAVYIDSVPVLPFIVGACGYLWLLTADNVDRVRRFGRRFTGDGRDVDVWEPSPLAAAGRRLGFIGVAAAVLLPMAIPNFTGGLLSQLTSDDGGSGGGGGNGGRISLFAGLSGQLNQTSKVNLIKLTTNEPNPFYLRFAVADQLSPDGTTSRQPSGRGLDLPSPSVPTGTDAQSYEASISITGDLRQNEAPVYSNTTQISGLGKGWSYDPDQQVVFSGSNTTKGKNYSITYVRENYTPTQLRDATPLTPGDPTLKADTYTPNDAKVANLVKTLTRGKTNEYDIVRALFDYFSRANNFTYSLSTGDADGQSAIDRFLTNKAGYCQQYASALMWMVRAAGIPARVAFGFTRGTGGNNSYEITNFNAHAWTEVYFKDFGWVPFDATPAADIPGSARSDSAYAPDVDQTAAPTASIAPDSTLPVPTGSASGAAGDAGHGNSADRNNTGVSGVAGEAVSGNGLWITIGILLLLALLLIPALARTTLRRRRHSATAPAVKVLPPGGPPGDRPPAPLDIVVTADAGRARADAHAAWDELLDTMADYRVPIDLSETPRLTVRRLVKESALTGSDAEAATLLGTAEEKARYARAPMRGDELKAALNDARRGISRSAGRRTRLIAVLMPPSTLLRWRLAISDRTSNAAAAASRARDVLVRFSPRRLLPRSSSR